MANLFFGTPPGVKEGELFPDRKSLIEYKLHRSTMHGIDGNGHEGVAAIVLSGGYEDDRDFGDEIIYTGHGGNDSATGQQIADQSWGDHGNLGMVVSEQRYLPVRVIRGYKHNSVFSPKTGYKYAGLFKVVEHWEEKGKSGFKICRFRLVKESTLTEKEIEVVKAGVLVKVRMGESMEKWFAIGVKKPASMQAQEISLDGKLGQALIGQKVGDFIDFGNGFTVLEIKKYRS